MANSRAMSEADAKRLLGEFGLRVSRETVVSDQAKAVEAAEDIGYPVVLKLCGDEILHKTEMNAVRLGLTNPDSVVEAADELLGQGPPGSQLLVAEQISGTRELIAGVTHDPQFGPALMFGVGGIFAEVLGDVVFRLLPADRSDIQAMLTDLDRPEVLAEFRGEPAVDQEALTTALVAIAECALANDDIESIDVNPMIVCDGEPVAVDALVVTR
ncbi:MAG: acetate--CoA ligase family protein [Acidimicrobiales bacterium]